MTTSPNGDPAVFHDDLFVEAVKAQLKGKVALVGPTGAGKTFTALQWARELAGPGGQIAFVDTENDSARLYANRFAFRHMKFAPPYDMDRLRSIIKYADGTGPKPGTAHEMIARPFDAGVIDSFTHFWKGEGGALDQVDAAAKRNRGGNSYTAWEHVTPPFRALLDAIVFSPIHWVVCMRSAMAYVLEEYTDSGGNKKSKPAKIGMAPEMRAGVEYEFTIVGDLNLDHDLAITKSRCDVIADRVVAKGRIPELAAEFHTWLDDGVELAGMAELEALRAMFAEITDEPARIAAKLAFVETFGRFESLKADQVDEAAAWIEQRTALPPAAVLAPVEPPAEPQLLAEAAPPPDQGTVSATTLAALEAAVEAGKQRRRESAA
jgi:hypothetical protein